VCAQADGVFFGLGESWEDTLKVLKKRNLRKLVMHENLMYMSELLDNIILFLHSKKLWVLSTQIWVKNGLKLSNVGSNMDKPKCWVKYGQTQMLG